MSEALYCALDAERAGVEARLASSAENRTPTEQAALEARLRTLHELLDRRSTNGNTWWRLTQILVVLAAGAILALGLWIRLTEVQVQLDARASGLTFTTAAGSPETREFANPRPFDVTSLLVRDGSGSARVDRKTAHVVGFVASPETSFEARADGAGCFLFTVGSRKGAGDQAAGLSLTILDAVPSTATSTSLPSPFPVTIAAGESLNLCLGNLKTTLLLARVVNIEFWRRHSDLPPRILISTLMAGKLRIAETGEALDLGLGDRLSLGQARNGWLLLTSGETAGITFAGTVRDAELVGISPENDHRVLRPSLAKYMATSPELTWLWGALLGIVGAIWSVRRFLFPSS